MPRKDSEAVPEGNGPVSQQDEFGSGEPTLADVYRPFEERFDQQQKRMDSFFDGMASCFDRWNRKLDEILDQHVTSLEQGARQPCFAMEADGQENTKTRERTEGAATAVQAMRGDCFSTRRVEPGPNINSTSSGVKAEPPALPCRDDVVVECGTAASESCLPSLEMRPSTAAGGLVPTGEASKATETKYNQPPLRLCSTEEKDHLEASCKKTSISSTSNDGSSVFQERNLSATPYCRRVVDTKSRQNRTFDDPGGRKVTSAPAHFWDRGARWFVARFYGLQLETSCSVFSEEIRWLFEKRPVLMPCQKKVSPSRAGRGYMNSREKKRSRLHGDSRCLEVRGERLSRSVMER